MDKLMNEILSLLRRNPDKKFSYNDLKYLQSPDDVKFAMIHLYKDNYPVIGEAEYSEHGPITAMKWIKYSRE
jgi:hypothetical protein